MKREETPERISLRDEFAALIAASSLEKTPAFTESDKPTESALPVENVCSDTEPAGSDISEETTVSDAEEYSNETTVANTDTAAKKAEAEKLLRHVNASELSQQELIHAPISMRAWVNAGPGSGKTYTVIKRLRAIFEEQDPEGTVLVLCFSKNAVRLVANRLRDEMGPQAESLIAEERLIIRTFDSFATYVMSDELPAGLNYDARISLFTKRLVEQPEALADISCLIVDEVQDTVGVRAEMLRCMIEAGNFGVILLGDVCQGIYDWAAGADSKWVSGFLFQWIREQGFSICALSENHRQSKTLAQIGNHFREALETDNQERQKQTLEECKRELKRLWPEISFKELPGKLNGNSGLVLCKTNGETALASDLFFSRDLPHTVLQGAQHRTLAPWIARILGGCTKPTLDQAEFNALAECAGVEGADEKWAALRSLDSHTRSAVLHREEVLRRISKAEALPDIFLYKPEGGVVVSTVHRAKGSEAERVYWLDTPLVFNEQAEDSYAVTDALKASYVAVTRAKEELRLVQPEKVYMRRLDEKRWYKTGIPKTKGKRPFCSGISILSDDADPLSFAEDEDVQETIATLEAGMDVMLYPSGNGKRFDIFFDGNKIGETMDSFTAALMDAFAETNKNKNLPAYIDSVYLSALTTVIETERTGNNYLRSGCWLGYELSGFGHINYC